ncbi:heavy-metal-associated domain-containing protein [Leifsonia poae]|uniref:heavy-metal-associated domain-containing protein n=1 Tax=Leifsonia poae TaxID=110933 RepID=UPI001CBC27ED|nr:heavy-metal-associated domain-containing protein [Leifsonia poae]
MRTGTRLALFGLGVVVAFGGAYGIAGALIPRSAVSEWEKGTDMNDHGAAHSAADAPKGVSLAADGFTLSPVEAPKVVGETGELSFRILDVTGAAVTDYATSHDRELHLIVARSDGSGFRHAHPVLNGSTGTWSAPWKWTDAGSYRVFADFTPAGAEAPSLTLTRTVEVAGEFIPVAPQPSRVDDVDGYTVSLAGELTAGTSSRLTITVARDGEPNTTLEPYLGAFGHLVALREGDLAFLHVHADGDEPIAGQTAGPTIVFAAEAPTAGRYLLYLDFQVAGQVHTAEFVLDAAPSIH